MNSPNGKSKNYSKLGVWGLAFTIFTVSASEYPKVNLNPSLSFDKAIKIAQKNDPWLTGNIHKQKALESMSIAANTLPDPKVSIGFANLPTDSFDFDQEGMTQAKVGITQMFPRGDTLAIKQRQLEQQSEAYPFQRENRKAKVAVTVGSLWLDAYRVQQSIVLIEQNRAYFEQLVDIAEASYSSALGKTRQQDMVRAQLELTRLEDRLDVLAQQRNRYEGMLAQWLTQFTDNDAQASYNPIANLTPDLSADLDSELYSLHSLNLSSELPEIDLINGVLVNSEKWQKPQELVPFFTQHPAVMAIDKKVTATQTSIQLARQSYKPEWGVNASYGYREDAPNGTNRADLFSVGVTFDLPLFTENRQDKQVQSAISQTEAVKTEKLLLLREFLGAYSSAKGRLQRLKARQYLYTSKLLPQTHDQAEASLTAYTNDDGDFAEVVRARIAVLNAEIDDLTLGVEEQKIHLELNYIFIGSLNVNMASNDINFENSNLHGAILGEKQ